MRLFTILLGAFLLFPVHAWALEFSQPREGYSVTFSDGWARDSGAPIPTFQKIMDGEPAIISIEAWVPVPGGTLETFEAYFRQVSGIKFRPKVFDGLLGGLPSKVLRVDPPPTTVGLGKTVYLFLAGGGGFAVAFQTTRNGEEVFAEDFYTVREGFKPPQHLILPLTRKTPGPPPETSAAEEDIPNFQVGFAPPSGWKFQALPEKDDAQYLIGIPPAVSEKDPPNPSEFRLILETRQVPRSTAASIHNKDAIKGFIETFENQSPFLHYDGTPVLDTTASGAPFTLLTFTGADRMGPRVSMRAMSGQFTTQVVVIADGTAQWMDQYGGAIHRLVRSLSFSDQLTALGKRLPGAWVEVDTERKVVEKGREWVFRWDGTFFFKGLRLLPKKGENPKEIETIDASYASRESHIMMFLPQGRALKLQASFLDDGTLYLGESLYRPKAASRPVEK